jgi:hypothetical protein
LTINNATAQAQPSLAKALSVASVTTTGTGELDLTNNAMVVKGSNLAAIQGLITTGFNGGLWTGPGINSSVAEADALGDGLLAIGYLDNAELGATDFEGVTDLDGDDILVKVTYYGDADLGGTVNLDDFGQLLAGLEGGPATWLYGDFDYSGVINLDDFGQFLHGYDNQGAPLSALAAAVEMSSLSASEQQFMLNAIAAVPEPGTLGLIACAGLLARRRS